MLLGMDHFVNTYNYVRCQVDTGKCGSFTVVAIVCDQGYQGPQSSFNALGDICSSARVPGFTITNNRDLQFIVDTQLTAPGFRFIAISQKMFPSDFLDVGLVYSADDGSVIQYEEGNDVTVVCFNFSLPDGLALKEKLSKAGLSSSLFSANYVPFASWECIKRDVAKTRKIVVIDDSKSVHLPLYTLLSELADPSIQSIAITRETNVDFGVCADNLNIDHSGIVETILQK
jgi:transketolase C-terminal domain/subunit